MATNKIEHMRSIRSNIPIYQSKEMININNIFYSQTQLNIDGCIVFDSTGIPYIYFNGTWNILNKTPEKQVLPKLDISEIETIFDLFNIKRDEKTY